MSGLFRRAVRDERGVTVVEVMVTMLVLAIVTFMAFDFLDRSTRIAVRTETQAQAEDDTQRSLRTVTQHLRGALPITGTCTTASYPTTYGNCVRFNVPRGTSGFSTCARTEFAMGLLGTGTEKQLVYDRQEFTGTTTCAAGPLSSGSVLLERVVNTAAQPLFTYYGDDGSVIDPATAAASVPGAASVKVSLHVRFRTDADPILMSSVAALRNNIS